MAATVNEPVELVLAFLGYHLALGASEVILFFDDPEDPAAEAAEAVLSLYPLDTFVDDFAGFMAVVGHCYPVWHGFRGGKGAATAVGAVLVIQPVVLIPMILAWLLVLVVTATGGIEEVERAVVKGWRAVTAAATDAVVAASHPEGNPPRRGWTDGTSST